MVACEFPEIDYPGHQVAIAYKREASVICHLERTVAGHQLRLIGLLQIEG